MRITIFIGGLSGGGAERVCCNVAGYLADKGHDVEMLTMADDEATYGLNPKISRVVLLSEKERKGFLQNSFVRYKRLRRYVSRTDRDAYIVMLPITILLLMSLRNKTTARIIASERNMPTLYPKWQQKAMKWIANKADGWVFQTLEQQEWYGEVIKGMECKVIPNAINSNFIRDRYSAERKKKIVTVGRLTAQKNQALLINAFALFREKYPHFELYIYGEGPLKHSLEELSKDLNIDNAVHFEGFVKDITNHIEDASVFVLSSNFEGIPNALLEAMAIGIPCVSTDCNGGGARFLINNWKNGIVVPRDNIYSLAQAMMTIVSDKELAESFSKEAHNVIRKFHPDYIYNEWETYIEKIVKL